MAVEQDSINDYVNALRRRLGIFSVVLGVIFVAAIVAALVLPDTYQSAAELRIDLEGPSVDLLEPVALTTYADQYVRSLQQKVLSYDNVKTWLDGSSAFAEERRDLSEADLISQIVDDVRILMVTTSVANPEGSGEVDLITGFTASYSSRDPGSAYFIADKVAAAFLAEDRALRTERAATTATFLSEQIESKRKEIVELESKIAVFKEQHAASLPDMRTLNLTNLERTERDLEEVQSRIRELQEDRIFRQAQLEEIRRSSPSAERAEQLQEDYQRAVAIYGPDHPNVMRMKRQVDALAATEVAGGTGELRQLEEELTEALQRYSDVHPNVVSLRRRIETLKEQGQPGGSDLNRNPSFLQLRAQVNAIDTELQSFRVRATELRRRSEEMEDRIARMPQVERDYVALDRDLQAAQVAFDDLSTRFVQAQQTESFESGERGARLEQISAADIPLRPSGPPRLAIAFLGTFLAVSCGGAAALAAETLDKTVRGSKDIRTLLQLQPIAVIPVIRNSLSIAEQRRKAAFLAMTATTLVVIVAIAVYWGFGI